MTRLAVYCQFDMEPLSIIEVAPEFLVMLEAKPGWSARVAWATLMSPVLSSNYTTVPTVSQVAITACKYRFNAAYGWFLMVDNRDFADALKGDALTVQCMPDQPPGRHEMAIGKLMGVLTA